MDLPDDALDNILRRVPPRHLAACRRVCKNWRAVIDGSGLVLAHLVPGPLCGIFINNFDIHNHSFFSRAAAPTSLCIDAALRFVPNRRRSHTFGVFDHSNGLVLYSNIEAIYVCNPATRRWATLPRPHIQPFHRNRLYLIFDPTVSLHYDVLYIPGVPHVAKPTQRVPKRCKTGLSRFVLVEDQTPSVRAKYEHDVNIVGSMEWPPYSYAVQVFSSRTGQWEERRFVREGDAVGTVSQMWSDPCVRPPGPDNASRSTAVYWQGAFYLHWRRVCVMRFSLLEEKYLLINTPILDTRSYINEYQRRIRPFMYLGKSKQGVYYTVLHGYQLGIWVLHEASESRRMPEWELKHLADLKLSFIRHYTRHHIEEEIDKSWILNPRKGGSKDKGDHSWDSDDDSIIDAEGGIDDDDKGYTNNHCFVTLLGYHPYKEIAFLGNHYDGFAYYLGSSKLQYLGSLYSGSPYHFSGTMPMRYKSYVYTPCIDDLLPDHSDPQRTSTSFN